MILLYAAAQTFVLSTQPWFERDVLGNPERYFPRGITEIQKRDLQDRTKAGEIVQDLMRQVEMNADGSTKSDFAKAAKFLRLLKENNPETRSMKLYELRFNVGQKIPDDISLSRLCQMISVATISKFKDAVTEALIKKITPDNPEDVIALLENKPLLDKLSTAHKKTVENKALVALAESDKALEDIPAVYRGKVKFERKKLEIATYDFNALVDFLMSPMTGWGASEKLGFKTMVIDKLLERIPHESIEDIVKILDKDLKLPSSKKDAFKKAVIARLAQLDDFPEIVPIEYKKAATLQKELNKINRMDIIALKANIKTLLPQGFTWTPEEQIQHRDATRQRLLDQINAANAQDLSAILADISKEETWVPEKFKTYEHFKSLFEDAVVNRFIALNQVPDNLNPLFKNKVLAEKKSKSINALSFAQLIRVIKENAPQKIDGKDNDEWTPQKSKNFMEKAMQKLTEKLENNVARDQELIAMFEDNEGLDWIAKVENRYQQEFKEAVYERLSILERLPDSVPREYKEAVQQMIAERAVKDIDEEERHYINECMQRFQKPSDWKKLTFVLKVPGRYEAALERIQSQLEDMKDNANYHKSIDIRDTVFLGLWRAYEQKEVPQFFNLSFRDEPGEEMRNIPRAFLRVNSLEDGNCFYHSVFGRNPELLLGIGYTVEEVMTFIKTGDSTNACINLRAKLIAVLKKQENMDQYAALLPNIARSHAEYISRAEEEKVADFSSEDQIKYLWEKLGKNREYGDSSEMQLLSKIFARNFIAYNGKIPNPTNEFFVQPGHNTLAIYNAFPVSDEDIYIYGSGDHFQRLYIWNTDCKQYFEELIAFKPFLQWQQSLINILNIRRHRWIELMIEKNKIERIQLPAEIRQRYTAWVNGENNNLAMISDDQINILANNEETKRKIARLKIIQMELNDIVIKVKDDFLASFENEEEKTKMVEALLIELPDIKGDPLEKKIKSLFEEGLV